MTDYRPDTGEAAAQQSVSAAPQTQGVPVPGASFLVDHWGLLLAYGLLSMALGLVLAVWPKQTLVLLAVLFAVQLIVSGVMRVVLAIAGRRVDGGVRVLVALSGVLGLIVGLLCLRHPLQTLLVLGLLIGIWWLVAGAIDIIDALTSPRDERRVWDLVVGVLTLLAGIFLVVNPNISLGVLVVVACVWFFAVGFGAIVAAVLQRRRRGGNAAETTSTALHSAG